MVIAINVGRLVIGNDDGTNKKLIPWQGLHLTPSLEYTLHHLKKKISHKLTLADDTSPENHKWVETSNSHKFILPIECEHSISSTKFGKSIKTNKPIKCPKRCDRAHKLPDTHGKFWREDYHI